MTRDEFWRWIGEHIVFLDCQQCPCYDRGDGCGDWRRRMTNGERIAYYIDKECSKWGLSDWLEDKGIDRSDWEAFLDAGKAGVEKKNKYWETAKSKASGTGARK